MQKTIASLVLASTLLLSVSGFAQVDKSKRPSPPAKVTQTLASGATISIDYSQPSLKGRVIGETVEPYKDTVWRMGANEATVFETDRDVTIDGQSLAKGKYSMFGLYTDEGFKIMFNSAWNISGTAYWANKATDVLTIVAQPRQNDTASEKLTYTIVPSGKVTLWWGAYSVEFMVK